MDPHLQSLINRVSFHELQPWRSEDTTAKFLSASVCEQDVEFYGRKMPRDVLRCTFNRCFIIAVNRTDICQQNDTASVNMADEALVMQPFVYFLYYIAVSVVDVWFGHFITFHLL